MEVGIIGLPKSGKTTIFNALTRGKAETGAFPSGVVAPNIRVVKVPDPRLETLTGIFKPKRTIPTEVKYVDIGAFAGGFKKGQGLGGESVTHLSRVDALIHVVRAFEDEAVPYLEWSLDPERDINTMELELAFSDLGIIERRFERLGVSLKGAKAQEREDSLREQALLAKIKAGLENEVAVREQDLTDEQARIIANYQFLSAKPLLVLLNIDEGRLSESSSLEMELRNRYRRPHVELAVLCGKLEMELAQLSETDAKEFRLAMGLDELALDRVLKLSYDLLGLLSFFTIVSEEVKAWTVPKGTTALKAAGKIHSDMERGFIRAEVIGHEDLVKCGSLAEARREGLLRLEGKNYIVQDGDVLTILFNV